MVGLDTMGHVIKTMDDTLPKDPWHDYYKPPAVLKALIDKGALGQKTGAGFFRKVGKDILVLDPAKQDYVPQTGKVSDEVAAILKIKSPAEQFAKLRASSDPQAQFLWAIHRDLFHYAAYWLGDIAESARDIDFAMRWGYGWKLGPFETWQAAGWARCRQMDRRRHRRRQGDEQDAAARTGRPIRNAPACTTTRDRTRHRRTPRFRVPMRRSTSASCFPETVLGTKLDTGKTALETDDIRLWTLGGDDIAILSFKTKMHTDRSGRARRHP